jgi:hypothetical protein
MKQPSRGETILLGGVLMAFSVALWGPYVPQHDHYHVFADQRTCLGLPCAMDVLTNLSFAMAGIWGLLKCASARQLKGWTVRLGLVQLFFAGLLMTFAGSCYYHLQPDDSGLLWDRAGMAGAFAGLLGIAVADRISERAGAVMAALVVVGGLLSVNHWAHTGNLLPWAVVQGGGMLLVLLVARQRPVAGGWNLPLAAVIFLYVVAKLLELGDHVVYAATSGWVSGHSLKHLFAAAAALPVLWVMHNRPQNIAARWLTASAQTNMTHKTRETQ